MIRKLIVQSVVFYALLAAALFAIAGRIDWPGAWVMIAEMCGCGLAMGFYLARHDPGLLRERMSGIVQKEQTPTDRRLMGAFAALFAAWFLLMALDGGRFRWSAVPLWLQVAGGILVLLCFYVVHLTFRANSFAAPVVKIQAERGQRVIDTGPYALVRHPMYAGALLLFVGAPLLLGSWWGLAGALVMTALLTVRIGEEERALRAGLPGYGDYAARVRWRLIPGLW